MYQKLTSTACSWRKRRVKCELLCLLFILQTRLNLKSEAVTARASEASSSSSNTKTETHLHHMSREVSKSTIFFFTKTKWEQIREILKRVKLESHLQRNFLRKAAAVCVAWESSDLAGCWIILLNRYTSTGTTHTRTHTDLVLISYLRAGSFRAHHHQVCRTENNTVKNKLVISTVSIATRLV